MMLQIGNKRPQKQTPHPVIMDHFKIIHCSRIDGHIDHHRDEGKLRKLKCHSSKIPVLYLFFQFPTDTCLRTVSKYSI